MRVSSAILCALTAALAGCTGQQMDNQPRYETFEASDLFTDGTSARPLPAGTLAREQAVVGEPALSAALLARGRERFDIFCSPCHGRLGDGTGMIVQRGFPRPPSYHSERLRQVPLRHFYDVITQGYGIMYAYADRVPPQDRWAIAAYIRALQLSRHASPADLPDGVDPTVLAAGGGS